MTSRRFSMLAAGVAAIATLVPGLPAHAISSPLPVPRGYRVTSRQDRSRGLVVLQYRSSNPLRVINIAYLRRSASEHFRATLSNEYIAGPNPRTETLSSMCRRVSCKVAVNGDFFSRTTAEPSGGMAFDGYPYRTPPDNRYHFYEDWSGNIGVRKLSMPMRFDVTFPNGVRSYVVNSLNSTRDTNRSALYSVKWGPSTETRSSGFELTLRATSKVTMNGPINVRIVAGRSGGNTKIPSDGFVLSGNGGYATEYARLWSKIQSHNASADATISMIIEPRVRMFMGGAPALLLGGSQAFRNDGSSLINTPDPHTFVGRNAAGDAIIATIDGRQRGWSNGINLIDGAAFMKALGCTEALNLDGGGSAEFVNGGRVIGRPSDGAERPLSAGLAIVS